MYFSVAGGSTISMSKSVGSAVSEFTTLFGMMKPDIVCLVGDRFETLGVATAAYMNNVPIAHLEGGELSGSIDEGVRHAITKLSSLHFPCTEGAGKVIRQLGENPDNIHVVGSTSLDMLDDIAEATEIWDLQKKSGSGAIIDPTGAFLLVCQHPVTNELQDTEKQVWETIWAVDAINMPTFWMNANLDAGSDIISSVLRQYRDQSDPKNIHFFKSLPIRYYGYLLKNTVCMVGNSSAGIRECSYLGTPSVNIGTRQQYRERSGNTVDVAHNHKNIYHKVKNILKFGTFSSALYGDGKASEKIVSIIKQSVLNSQKVFYEIIGDCACKGGEQGSCKQECSDVIQETTLPMGVENGGKFGGIRQDYNFNRY